MHLGVGRNVACCSYVINAAGHEDFTEDFILQHAGRVLLDARARGLNPTATGLVEGPRHIAKFIRGVTNTFAMGSVSNTQFGLIRVSGGEFSVDLTVTD